MKCFIAGSWFYEGKDAVHAEKKFDYFVTDADLQAYPLGRLNGTVCKGFYDSRYSFTSHIDGVKFFYNWFNYNRITIGTRQWEFHNVLAQNGDVDMHKLYLLQDFKLHFVLRCQYMIEDIAVQYIVYENGYFGVRLHLRLIGDMVVPVILMFTKTGDYAGGCSFQHGDLVAWDSDMYNPSLAKIVLKGY